MHPNRLTIGVLLLYTGSAIASMIPLSRMEHALLRCYVDNIPTMIIGDGLQSMLWGRRYS